MLRLIENKPHRHATMLGDVGCRGKAKTAAPDR